MFSDPSGSDSIIYGMAGQSVAANSGGPMGGHVRVNMGARSEYEMSWEGHNGTRTFFGSDAANVLRGFGSTYIAGSFSLSQTTNADGSVDLGTLNLGYWVQNSADKVGLVGIYGGTYLDMLSDYADTNSKTVFKFGSAQMSAAELTLDNASYMSKVSKVAGVASKYLGIAGAVLSGISIASKLANGQNVSTGEYVGLAVGVGFLVASAIAATSAVVICAVPIATIVTAAAITYGVGQIISYTSTGKTIEQNIFD